MLKPRMRNLAVTGITIVSATILTALFATTGASASVTATANPGHAGVAATTVVHAAPAAANASAAPDSSTTPYYVCSTSLGCIFAPGHGGTVGTRYARNTTLNLVFQETAPLGGVDYDWYWLRFNGTNECLNYSPTSGFVYEDSCIKDDRNEMWEHHVGDFLYNAASGFYLYTCQDYRASLLAASIPAGGCAIDTTSQYSWLFIPA